MEFPHSVKDMNFRQLQHEVAQWSEYNFGAQAGYKPLLGAVEEIGELCHAHLKHEQGIRTTEDHWNNKIDAIGDVIVYLADYAYREGIDLQAAIEQVWSKCRQRDWKKNPATAHEGEPQG